MVKNNQTVAMLRHPAPLWDPALRPWKCREDVRMHTRLMAAEAGVDQEASDPAHCVLYTPPPHCKIAHLVDLHSLHSSITLFGSIGTVGNMGIIVILPFASELPS